MIWFPLEGLNNVTFSFFRSGNEAKRGIDFSRSWLNMKCHKKLTGKEYFNTKFPVSLRLSYVMCGMQHVAKKVILHCLLLLLYTMEAIKKSLTSMNEMFDLVMDRQKMPRRRKMWLFHIRRKIWKFISFDLNDFMSSFWTIGTDFGISPYCH